MNLSANEFSTPDMGLVAYLRYEGAGCKGHYWEDGNCYWVFDLDQKTSIHRVVVQFNGALALVEPIRYNRIYGEVKKEFRRLSDSQPTVAR